MRFQYQLLLPFSATTAVVATSLPIVDLGYELHQALTLNESSGLYNFSNIRYAEPPVGDLRWALPLAPTGVNTTVQDGAVGRICPQGLPDWYLVTSLFQESYAAGTMDTWDYATALEEVTAAYPDGLGPSYASQLYTTDDCLFLNVVVPEKIFAQGSSAKAPVLVWIHGGAYVAGNKVDSSSGDPTGLIATSQKDGSDGIIYVSMNYRLGGLGFMSGKTYEDEGGVLNLGLHDQRLALEWVQKYISIFGGDPDNVTVAGGSAGAGSIIYHLVSKSDNTFPFQKAWVESPGLIPATDASIEASAETFLNLLGVSSFAEAREKSSQEIILANANAVAAAKNSTFQYAPVQDGSFIPDTVLSLLNSGQVQKDVNLLISHVENEGYTFSPGWATTDEAFTQYLYEMFPEITENEVYEIVNELYPLSAYDNLWYERVAAFVGDYGLKCYTNDLSKAYENATYNYEWEVFPAFHGYDFLQVFYSGDQYGGIVNTTYATILQLYISNFVKVGNPNGEGLVVWPEEDSTSQILYLPATGPVVGKDSTASAQCLWLEEHQLLV